MSISGYPWCLFVPRFDFVLLHVWDPKHRLCLQLIPLRKALVKMNEPPPAWGPAEKAPLPPWKRLHILSVSHHQSCILGAVCSITSTKLQQQSATGSTLFTRIPVKSGSIVQNVAQLKVISQEPAASLWDPHGTEGKARTRKNRDFWSFGTNKEEKKMAKPNYTGTYHMVEQENMDSYLGALGTNLYTVF